MWKIGIKCICMNFFKMNYEKWPKNKKKHRNANKNHMKEISDESIMMKCSLRKFDMAWFKVNRNRC